MLTLLLCSDWVAGRNAVLSRINDNIQAEKPGNILIVPELISHDTERRLSTKARSPCKLNNLVLVTQLCKLKKLWLALPVLL